MRFPWTAVLSFVLVQDGYSFAILCPPARDRNLRPCAVQKHEWISSVQKTCSMDLCSPSLETDSSALRSSTAAACTGLSLAYCRRRRSLARILPSAPVSRSQTAFSTGLLLACCRRNWPLARMLPPAQVFRILLPAPVTGSRTAAGTGISFACCRPRRSLASILSLAPVSCSHTAISADLSRNSVALRRAGLNDPGIWGR